MAGAWEILCEHVSKDYEGRQPSAKAVADLNLAVGPARRVALVGPNGAGKSTVLRLIAGVERPTNGSRTVSGDPSIFWLPQDYRSALLPWLTLFRNVELFASGYSGRFRDVEAEYARMLKEFALGEIQSRFPYTLSGGEHQLSLLALGLVCSPDLLVLDEPLSAVDYARRRVARPAISRLLLERPQMSLYLATHDFEEAVLFADEVLVFSATPMPAMIRLPIELPWPRTPESVSSPKFMQYVERIMAKVL